MISDLFMERVKENGQWSFFDEDQCPGLMDAYGDEYKQLYQKYETEGKAIKTVEVRSQEQGEPCHYESTSQGYVVYRTRDNKVMKNINYFRPNLKQFFTEEEIANCKKG